MIVLLIVLGVVAGFGAGMFFAWWKLDNDRRTWLAAGEELEAAALEAQAEAERLRKENISLLNEKLRA